MVELLFVPPHQNQDNKRSCAFALNAVSFSYKTKPQKRQESQLQACTSDSEGVCSHTLFEKLSCTLYEGGFYYLSGESGLGKTSFLRLLLGLEEPSEGSIVRNNSLRVGALFQDDCLLEDLSLAKNLLLVQDVKKTQEKREFSLRAQGFLRDLRLNKDLHTLAKELSGGQKRRLALARTLLVQSDVFILDEPLRGIDDNTKEEILPLIQEVLAGKTVIWVSHNKGERAYFQRKNTQFQEISFIHSSY